MSNSNNVINQASTGVYHVQGMRPYMEDRHSIVDPIHTENETTYSYFGVFDGHGGDLSASWYGDHLHESLKQVASSFSSDMEAALNKAVEITDKELLDTNPALLDDGTTIVFSIIQYDGNKAKKIWTVNSGDSRAILGKSVEDKIKAFPLSDDHKPNRPDEKERIEKQGGTVRQSCLWSLPGPYRIFNSQNQGGLAVSRGGGDRLLKRDDLVLLTPEITTVDVTDDCKFLVIASDGLWDNFSNQEVATLVGELYLKEVTPQAAAEHLVNKVDRPADNVTVVIVYL